MDASCGNAVGKVVLNDNDFSFEENKQTAINILQIIPTGEHCNAYQLQSGTIPMWMIFGQWNHLQAPWMMTVSLVLSGQGTTSGHRKLFLLLRKPKMVQKWNVS